MFQKIDSETNFRAFGKLFQSRSEHSWVRTQGKKIQRMYQVKRTTISGGTRIIEEKQQMNNQVKRTTISRGNKDNWVETTTTDEQSGERTTISGGNNDNRGETTDEQSGERTIIRVGIKDN